MKPRMPPGRAGHLWLRHRLDIARRGLDLLDRKLRILRHEQERLDEEAARTGEEWRAACANAETWLLRTAVLGGQRVLRLAEDPPDAEVVVHWRDAMGARYPDQVTCRFPELPELVGGTAALAPTRRAHRHALNAAARHAAALEASRVLAVEVTATRRRIRSIQRNWIPLLERELATLGTALDETERGDNVRLHRAVPTDRDRPAPSP